VIDHTTHHTEQQAPKQRPKFINLFAGALIAVGVFAAGVGVGSGRIAIGPDLAFKKPATQNLPSNLDYSSVEQVYDSLKKHYDGELKNDDLLDGLKEGLARATGDPYTEYMDAEEAKDFNESLTGTFSGIGAELGKEQNTVVIVAPISGFPAEKAGLQPKDVIIEIDGETAYDITVSDRRYQSKT
jgi:carboxyl-terminal processing protease